MLTPTIDATTLIAGRAIAGLGAAGIATGAYLIVAFAVPPQERPTYNGLMAAMYGVSAIAGPLLGGVFSDKVTWRWCFYISKCVKLVHGRRVTKQVPIDLPIGGLVGGLILFFFRTPSQAQPVKASWREKIIQMDLPGAALIMGALISFILAMQYGGQTRPWIDSVVIGLLIGCGLMTIAFIALEAYLGERAMVPPRLIKQRSVWVGSCFQLCFGASYFILLYYLPIYFQSVDGTSPIGSGVRNLPMIIPVVIASIVGGVFISKTGYVAAVAVFGAALGTISAGLLYSLDIDSSAGKWIGYQVIGGFGCT
jgi:MFS family permease